MALAALGSSLAGLLLHFVNLGDDPDFPGCSSQFRGTKFWMLWCTREKGACNALRKWQATLGDDWSSKLACNEAVGRTAEYGMITNGS
jgi:hypothetical protein